MRLRRSALARKGEARAGDTCARYVKLREVRKSSRQLYDRIKKKNGRMLNLAGREREKENACQ